MLELPEIVRQLQNENLNKVSMDTHINYQQVWRIKSGKDCNPTYKTMKSLSDYFLGNIEKEFSLLFNVDDITVIDNSGGRLLSDCLENNILLCQELGELFSTALLLKA